MTIRRVLLCLGQAVVETGDLSKAEDVFCLTLDEVRSLPERVGTPNMESLRSVVKRRFEEYRANQFLVPPAIIRSDRASAVPERKVPKDSHILRGLACSGGVHTGTARVIYSKLQFHSLRPGDILVCPIARPYFSFLFGKAGGIITDVGGMLSHGAILAREYSIPAVLSVMSATSVIQDGDLLTVNGDRGEIIIHFPRYGSGQENLPGS